MKEACRLSSDAASASLQSLRSFVPSALRDWKVVLKMKGFVVNRVESVYVEPDPRFFLTLAKRLGDKASVDFFEAFTKSAPEAHPVYIEEQTDYSGCIRFGTMSLVDSYKQWTDFGKKYPNRYANEVRAKAICDGFCGIMIG